jgi:23S rRNA (uracil1939-C5)-methyltransferase
MSKLIPFKVDYIDNLGQGVSRQTDKITLLNRVLPGESGQASIQAEQSKIIFAKPYSFDTTSSYRVIPACPHFDHCQGCHFLHTSYDYEQQIKHLAYSKLFRKWLEPEAINFVGSEKRDHYRTRIQLHYDVKKALLGYQTRDGILPVPNCKLPTLEIQRELQELYHQNAWTKLLPKKQPLKGHLELSINNDKVEVVWNKAYAQGGFTQVNRPMNQKILHALHQNIAQIANEDTYIVDLFGGKGNLTKNLSFPTKVVDYLDKKLVDQELASHQSYLSLNIYDKNAENILANSLTRMPDILIVDPPRSGLKNLNDFIQALKPKHIIYISCSPNTLSRDLKSIESQYKLTDLSFFDFFPSTYHLEAFAALSRLD